MIKLNFIALLIVATLINSAVLFSAFEAHVINVTATIERHPNQCDPKSANYWLKHDGCQNGGVGGSDWADEVNVLSGHLSGAFVTYDGAAICAALWPDNCETRDTRAGKLCQAKAETLVNELNLVSGHLDPEALLAGADNGSGAFDHLGLSATSTITEALETLERVLADENIDEGYLLKARQVARLITAFYEDENPLFPQCVFEFIEPEIIPDELIEFEIIATSTEEIIKAEVAEVETEAGSEVEIESTTTIEITEEIVGVETVEEPVATTTEETFENIEVIEIEEEIVVEEEVVEPEPEEIVEEEVIEEEPEEVEEEVVEEAPEPESESESEPDAISEGE